MKADIPDKILINRGEDGRIHHSYWTTDQQLVPFEDTLYIRKDALMELLQGMIQSCKTKNGFPAGTLAAVRIETLETVISRIEEICKEAAE